MKLKPSSIVAEIIATIVALGPLLLLVVLIGSKVHPDCCVEARHYASYIKRVTERGRDIDRKDVQYIERRRA